MPAPQDLAQIKERLQARRAAAIASYQEHRRPDNLLHELRRIVDQTLRQLARVCPLPADAALAAVGGYGRGELYPYSDVDLLLLLPQAPSAEDEEKLSQWVAALWDIGLEPGHSVRTVEECCREATSDITIETSLLESRFLLGNKALMRRFEDAIQQQLDPRRFFLDKQLEMEQRHSRYQYTPYSLEPNCKESPGGLRDLQVIMWMARAGGFGDNWRAIARNGLLTNTEARDLRRAELAFKELRIALHLLAGRREDRVLFDFQARLAEVYGIGPKGMRRASEVLMQRYYWAARLVTQLNTILVLNIEQRLFPPVCHEPIPIDEDFVNENGRLAICRHDAFERKPALLLRAFLCVQQHPELNGMTAETLRAIWHNRDRIDGQYRRNPVNRRLFLQILQQPRGIVHALRAMNMLNILPRYLPVFRSIVGQMQHDLFHVYTVDQHTLAVIRYIRRFTMAEHAQEYPLASQLIATLDDHWLLYVAALFHDIAKGRGGDHSELGSHDVKRFAVEHSLSKEDTDLVEFLVRQHLLMSTVAQKRDLSDPDVIRDFAQQVGSVRRLKALYLLTVADIRGTSPKVWNAWKGKLLEDLYFRTREALGGKDPGDLDAALARRRQTAIRLTQESGLSEEARENFWKQLDVAYFLRHDADEIAWHAIQLHNHVADAQSVVSARPAAGDEGLQILVYTQDSSDLFMTLCAYFDASNLSIQDARIHTTRQGWALDSFIVLSAFPETDLHAQARHVEKELSDWLARRHENHAAPSCSLRSTLRQSRRSQAFPLRPHIELQPDERSQSWRLSLVAADRAGLLHDLARIFKQHGINLQTAKIMTLGERVEDIFVIDGPALETPRSQMRFERDLLDMLGGRTQPPPQSQFLSEPSTV